MLGVIGHGRMGTAFTRAASTVGLDVAVSRVGHSALDGLVERASMVVLALPFPVALRFSATHLAGRGRDRPLVDVTNPQMCPGVVLPAGRSGGELIAAAATGWRVVKAFNTVPADQLGTAGLGGAAVSVPLASDHAAAAAEVAALARALGFQPLDAGGLADGRHLESLALLLARISHRERLAGRIGIHIGQPTAVEMSDVG